MNPDCVVGEEPFVRVPWLEKSINIGQRVLLMLSSIESNQSFELEKHPHNKMFYLKL